MHLDLMRDESATFRAVAQPDAVRSLRIWHCAYRTLDRVSDFRNLQTLVIATFPDPTLSALSPLSQLRYLSIVHMPRITDLSPLMALAGLESLSLATLPSWDSSGKTMEVDSLDPIAHLRALRHLGLFGVCPKDRSLAAVERCESLQSARFSKYPKFEVARFYQVTRVSDAHVPEPEFATG